MKVVKARDWHGRGQRGHPVRRPVLERVVPSSAMLWETFGRCAPQRRVRPLRIGEQGAPSAASGASVERTRATGDAAKRGRPMHHIAVRSKIHLLAHATDLRARWHIVHRVYARPFGPGAITARAVARGVEGRSMPHGAIESRVTICTPQAPVEPQSRYRKRTCQCFHAEESVRINSPYTCGNRTPFAFLKFQRENLN